MSWDTVVMIGASMAALVVLSAATFFCSNRQRRATSPSTRRVSDDGDVELGRRWGAAAGLDEAVLAAYPTAVYSSRRDEDQAAAAPKTASADGRERLQEEPEPPDDVLVGTLCAVCLADYADGDELRRLPGCRHAFHRQCVDQWLRLHPTCPVCRTSPTAAD